MGVGAKFRRGLGMLLETEVGQIKVGILSELLENSVGDLGIAGELLGMRAD